jgi:glycerate kinase
VEGGAGELHAAGFTALFSITDGPCALEFAMHNADALLERAAEQALRLFLAGRQP